MTTSSSVVHVAVRLDLGPEGQAVLVELARGSTPRWTSRAGTSPARSRARGGRSSTRGVVLALLLQRVLDLEQVGEVAARLEPNREADRLVVVVEDRQLLVEAVADGAPANHRQLRVDVDRARTGHEEEAGLEVLQVVDRERVEPLAVDASAPTSRGSACRTRRGRSGRSGDASMSPRSSLTTKVLPSRILTSSLIAAPSRSRRRRLSTRCARSRAGAVERARAGPALPSTVSSPRKTAAMAFALPVNSRSASARSQRMTRSAGALPLRNLDVALVHREQPALRSLAVDDVEAHRRRTFSSRGSARPTSPSTTLVMASVISPTPRSLS